MLRAPESARTPTAARRLLRLAGCTLFFVLAGYVGRATVIDKDSLSLIWPAAGVAALWLGSGNRRTWPGDVAALAIATYFVNTTTGASAGTALVFTVSNVAQVGVFVILSRHWIHDTWGLGGSRELHRLGDLGRLVIVAVAACLLGATIGAIGLGLTEGPAGASTVLVWWGRNTVSLIVVTTLGLLAGPPLFAATSARDLGRILYSAVYARTLARLVEAELLIATSAGLYYLLFSYRTGEPLAFLLLVMSVWAGLRFKPVAVMAHGLAMGIAGMAFTLSGYGPFAGIEPVHYRALVAQLFVATTVLTGLALAFSRVERDNATRRLAKAQREADERARLLGAVLESMSEGLVVLEEGGGILVSNTASRALLGLSKSSGTLQPAEVYGLFHDDGSPLTDEEMPGLRALAGEHVAPADFHLRVDSVPEGRVLEVSARPLLPEGSDDNPRAMVNIRDVTLDRQHRDALASFAGVVAHDLFNPLTIIAGWAESLEDEFAEGSVSAKVGLPMVARVDEAARHMRHVIGDLLSYTIARDQSLRMASVDLTTELRGLARLREHGPGNPLISVGPDLHVWADAGLVRQLFDNLLGNAVKYVAPGVRPRVVVGGERDGDWLEFRVSDNGIGIPEDQRELVFETFHRAHSSNGYQGTGLGLAICRRIVDRHGGSIRAEAGPDGLGTSFVLQLPATSRGYAAGRPRQSPSRPPRQGRQERQSV
jgi:signal transduction histidine kinase